MSDITYVVQISNQPVVVRATPMSFGTVRVTSALIGQLRVAGGVPGPAGAPGDSDAQLITDHIVDTTPHPAYDDLPSMTLLFENGLI